MTVQKTRVKAIVVVLEWLDYSKKTKVYTTSSQMMGFVEIPKVIRMRSLLSGKFSTRYRLYNRSMKGLWYISESGKTKLHIVNV